MTSTQLSSKINCTAQYIRAKTKKALEQGANKITIGGVEVLVSVVSGVGGGGKKYKYTIEENIKTAPRKRRVGSGVVNLTELPKVDFTKSNSKISVNDKLELVKFIKKHSSSVLAIARVYSLESGIKEGTLQRRIQRWVDAYEKGGKSALEDKRGGNRASKVDYELFLSAIAQQGHMLTYYSRYAFLECKKLGNTFNVFEPEKGCSISYSGFVKYFNRAKSNPEVKAILSGVDAVDNMMPRFKIKTNYPNEWWQIDATTLDIMVKVPVIGTSANYFKKIESEEYILKRFSLIGVIDRYSKARVYILSRSDTSYSDVRLIEKAINKLGKPEIIKGDNGKNYVSKHFQEVLEDLGIAYMASNPYAGYEKGHIERGFRTLQHNYLFENLPGFIGHNTEDRKKIENQAAGKSLMGKSGTGTQTHLKDNFMWWWEAEHVLDGLIEHMFSKNFEEHKAILPEFNTVPNLHILLGKKHSRKVNFEGIYFNKKYYLNSKLWNYFNIGDRAEIYEEIDDINRVHVKLPNGTFIECISEDEFEISVEEAKEIKKAYKNRRNKVLKNAQKVGKEGRGEFGEAIVDSLAELSTLSKEQVKKVVPKKKANNMFANLKKIASNAGY